MRKRERRNLDCRLYYRADRAHGNSLVKIEVGEDGRWLPGDELRRAYHQGTPADFDLEIMLHMAVKELKEHGLADVDRLLQRKQVFLPRIVPEFRTSPVFGWKVLHYPRKFVPQDAAKCLADVRLCGISLDASNLIKSDSSVDTGGLAVKAAVDLLTGNGIPFNMYTDWSLWSDLRGIGGRELYDYMMGFSRVGVFNRVFTARPEDPHCRGKADPMMLYWADQFGMHTLSRDEFDEFDLEYDFVLHGAEWGRQRLHKFRCGNGVFSIPDLGLSIDVPDHF